MNTVSTASNEPLKMQKLFQFNIESKFRIFLTVDKSWVKSKRQKRKQQIETWKNYTSTKKMYDIYLPFSFFLI